MHCQFLSIHEISNCSFVDDPQNSVWLYSYQIASAAIIDAPAIFHAIALTPTRTQQVDFHLAFGLNRNSPDRIVGIGYSWRFDNLFAAATR
jgi:hypothetical protein